MTPCSRTRVSGLGFRGRFSSRSGASYNNSPEDSTGRSNTARKCFSTKVTWPCWRWASKCMTSSRSAAWTSGLQQRPRKSHLFTPEVEEVEPVVGLAATILFQQRGISADRCLDGRFALARAQVAEIRQRLEYGVIAVAALVDPQYE